MSRLFDGWPGGPCAALSSGRRVVVREFLVGGLDPAGQRGQRTLEVVGDRSGEAPQLAIAGVLGGDVVDEQQDAGTFCGAQQVRG